jgi:pyridoxal phosphate enzyme (YggS family)
MSLSISKNIEKVRHLISQFEKNYARIPDSVQLIAVSKTHPAEKIRKVVNAGQAHIAENYLQEALGKSEALHSLNIIWHFIGPIQSNKTQSIAEHFHWVHSVDRLKIAQRLSAQRPTTLEPLKILLQVNISGENSKSGVALDELEKLATDCDKLPGILLSGLMSIPAPTDVFEVQRQQFQQLREARDNLLSRGFGNCNELSMGMSGDFEAAIAEGATMIRIGTDIFGPRAQQPDSQY